jgi:hypothetical protein
MPGLSESFEDMFAQTAQQEAEAITTGLVVLDTNVLLDAYRFAPTVRTELFAALQGLGDRLWIPHQVAYEFHANRYAVMAECAEEYQRMRAAIGELAEAFQTRTNAVAARFAQRSALPPDAVTGAIAEALATAAQTLERLWSRHEVPAGPDDDDPILRRLQAILAGRVGPAWSAAEADHARAEALERYRRLIPPGYEDRDKPDSSGDYLIWRQCLAEAKARQLPLVFVSREAKADWVWRQGGWRLGPRPELTRECRGVAGVGFTMLPTSVFLRHAQRVLHAPVGEATIGQVSAAEAGAVAEERRRAEVVRRLEQTDRVGLRERAQEIWRQLEEGSPAEVADLLAELAAVESTLHTRQYDVRRTGLSTVDDHIAPRAPGEGDTVMRKLNDER